MEEELQGKESFLPRDSKKGDSGDTMLPPSSRVPESITGPGIQAMFGSNCLFCGPHECTYPHWAMHLLGGSENTTIVTTSLIDTGMQMSRSRLDHFS